MTITEACFAYPKLEWLTNLEAGCDYRYTEDGWYMLVPCISGIYKGERMTATHENIRVVVAMLLRMKRIKDRERALIARRLMPLVNLSPATIDGLTE